MLPRRQLELFEALTFDCYGTLIDWESGILSALRPILKAHGIRRGDREILELYARVETGIEAAPYRAYRDVLREIVRCFGREWSFSPTAREVESLPDSLKSWRPFPDTVEALRFLKRRYRLAVISNVDEDLFADTARVLEVPFDWAITADQVRAYKPSALNFVKAIDAMSLPFNRVLHVAQSLYHDIIPARTLGLCTVWVNRRKGKKGFGATPAAEAKPDIEVPDLKSLVALLR